MPFEILNEAASVVYVLAGENRYPQAEPDKVDFDILAQGVNGEGVVSGAVVTPQGVPDTTVAVAAAVVRIAGTDVAFAGGNVACGAAAVALPRFDLIAIDNAGVASAVNGVAAAVPVFPAVPANSVIVAAVWRAANDNTITAADIVDKRCLLLGDALGTAPTLLGIVGGIATPNRSHHTLSAQAGAADDLDGMTVGTVIANGEIVIIRPDAGDTITVKHNALGGADARNILCIGNADIVLDDDHDFAICIYVTAIGAGSWMALGGGGGAGGHVIENEGVPLAARANLNFTGGLVDAVDNAPDTDVHIGKQPDRTDLFTTANANPHLTVGGVAKGIRFNDHVGIQSNPSVAPDTGLRSSPIKGGVTDWRGIELAPVLTFAGNNRAATGIFGSANAFAPAASTGQLLFGLNFIATALFTAAGAATFDTVGGCRSTAGLFTNGAGRTLTITNLAAFEAVLTLTVLGGAVCNITAVYGLHVFPRNFANITTVANAYGIRVEDWTNVSGNSFLLEIGPATPYLRLLGDGNPAANQTNLYLKEQATLRQVQWMDPGAGGANFVGGERVMILV